MSFRIKLFITFVIYGSVLALATQLLVLKLSESSVKKEAIIQASVFAETANDNFNSYIKHITQRLRTVEDSKLFQQLYEAQSADKNNFDSINQLFFDMTKNSSNIMQMRYIDKNGNEINRIERNSIDSAPSIVPISKLQNKKDRYYFKEIIKLDKSQYWYSRIDLNVEHGAIEKPVKPVIRVGSPFFYKGEKVGILIINIFMKDFLAHMTENSLYDVYLMDKDGYLLFEPSHEYCWNRFLKQKISLPVEFKNDLSKILNEDSVLTANYYSQKIFTQNLEDLYMIIIPDMLSTNDKIINNAKQLLWILLTVLLLSIPLSYFVSIAPSKLKQEVDELNANLKGEALDRDVLLSLFDLSDSVLFKWKNDETWSVNSVSKSVKNLLGYSKEDFETHRIVYSNCIHKDDLPTVTEEVTTAMEEEKYFFTHEPYRIITKVGDVRWILDHTVIVRDQDGEVINFVGYLSDITEIKEKEFILEELARTDQLTQISNRVYLDEYLSSQYYRYQRNAEPCSVILIDIDFFKLVNDDYGHIVGDKILIAFAKLLQSCIREGDILGRWGGEEFLIVLPYTTMDKAALLAEKIRQKIEDTVFDEVGTKTASFGVYGFEDGITIEKLIDNADTALYKAKSSGRNNVQIYGANIES